MGRNHVPDTFEEALETDVDVIHEKEYLEATLKLGGQLNAEKETIKRLILHHLGLGSDARIRSRKCILGNFNVCLPVEVKTSDAPWHKLVFRCAMPHKLGELRSAGAVDEKMRCEVAAYAWMQENCPDVRIPHLYGFGFTDHRQFTHESRRPLFTRALHFLRRIFHTLLRPSVVLSRYVSHPSQHRLSTAYMLLEDVSSDGSRMLSDTWQAHGHDQRRRQNFYRDYSRIIISLARVPQPRIGAFRFHLDGTITLANRPLRADIAILENDGAPRFIPRDRTYTSTESYVSDMLSFQAGRLSTHRNAAEDDRDTRLHMTAEVVFRAVAHNYILADRREGPFVLQFDDLHRGNIFVDDDWNIRSIVDLEWLNAQPLEMLHVPHWLAPGDLSSFTGDQLNLLIERRREFMEIFEAEERKAAHTQEAVLTNAINWSWERSGSWFWLGIHSVNALVCMFIDHIGKQYGLSASDFGEKTPLSQLWCPDSEEFVKKKVEDYEAYHQALKKFYSEKA